jgi:glycogen operon protein
LALRRRQARNLLATLLLSTGTPMLTAGDERWRTQGGNNNAYCLDNEVSWLSWAPTKEADDLLAFARKVIALRADSPALRQPEFFDGRPTHSGKPDLVWFATDGVPMSDDDWFDEERRTLGMWIDGSTSLSRDRSGELIPDDNWLVVLHAGAEPVEVTLPGAEFGDVFVPVLDSGTDRGTPAGDRPVEAGKSVPVPPRTLLVFRTPRITV